MKKPRYLSEELSRHGRVCYYVRVPGRPRVRLHVTGLDDPKFDKLYAAALLGQTPPEKPAARKLEKAGVGSFREVCQRFYVALERDPHLERKT